MRAVTESVITELREARGELTSVKPSEIVGQHIKNWYERWKETFKRSDSLTGRLDHFNLKEKMNGFWDTVDYQVADWQRRNIVERIDSMITALDAKQEIKPVLEDLISKVRDQKLAALLNEFNSSRTSQPNVAAIAFRTIFALIVYERAKIVAPESSWAQKDDLGGFEESIDYALDRNNGLFSSDVRKHIKRYKNSSLDHFNNVAHKPATLVDKEILELSVELLNWTLPELEIKG